MIPEVLPVCPFGNIKWWAIFLQANERKVFLNGYENYQKQTWRNRYDILGANGKQKLTVPISKESGKKIKTADIQLYSDNHWKKVHWRSIKSAYGSSPFWIYYSDQVEKLFSEETDSLFKFSLSSITLIIEELQLNKEINVISEKPLEIKDHSYDFKPTKCSFKSDPYLQVFNDRFAFEQNLSILDLLFNLGPEAENYILSIKKNN